jgi:hypothetical protein
MSSSDEDPEPKSLCMKISRLNVKINVCNINQNMLQASSASLEIVPKSIKIIKIKMDNFDWNFYYCLVHYTKNSAHFKNLLFQLFVKFLTSNDQKNKYKISFGDLKRFLENHKNVTRVNPKRLALLYGNSNFLVITMHPVNLNEYSHIIRAWTTIVLSWFNKKLAYDCYGAFFSTLGGAYSSLGEDSNEMALKAEKISLKQLSLAKAFNDPNAICRCKLFLAFAYTQLKNYKLAGLILKNEYRNLKDNKGKNGINDERLSVMCIAGIKKLRFCKNQAKIVNFLR